MSPEIENCGTFAVELLALPGFSMMALSATIEPLRSVNRLAGDSLYRWIVTTPGGGRVTASNGLELSAEPFMAKSAARLTIVVASLGIEGFRDAPVLHALRQRRSGPMSVGAVSNGALLLGRAGLLRQRRATIHWEMQQRLAEEIPEAEITDRLFCIDREVITAGGGTAGMDMMLAFIAMRDGREIAGDVAEQFLHGRPREGSETQRLDTMIRYKITNPHLLRAIRIMERHQSDPVKIGRVAELVGVSERQLERCFDAAFGMAPSDFYMSLRLKAARRHLLDSTEPLEAIAELTGFSSPGHFSRAFKAWAGIPPSVLRRRSAARDVGKMQESGDVT